MNKIIFLILAIVTMSFTKIAFKSNQLTYPRVKKSYEEKWSGLKSLISLKGIDTSDFQVYLRAFKMEGKFEVWIKDNKKSNSSFSLVKTYDICKSSGVLGPKRKEGDLQVPEGFYKISSFNPTSRFYLGMLVNYPNQSDLVRSDKNNPGGSIMVHGDCVTIGCIPLTDEYIKEVYILCLESQNSGYPVRIDIFPCHFNQKNDLILKQYSNENQSFWNELRPAYTKFNSSKSIPEFTVAKNGVYVVN